jgi:hypothetical protein
MDGSLVLFDFLFLFLLFQMQRPTINAATATNNNIRAPPTIHILYLCNTFCGVVLGDGV